MHQTIIISLLTFLLSYNFSELGRHSTISEISNDSLSRRISALETKNKEQSAAITDTTSSEYLIYLLKNERPLNPYWTKKLGIIKNFYYDAQDTLTHLALIRDWIINDSISVIIFSIAGPTNYDEFLITVKNKHDLVSSIHISDNDDSDLSFGNPYYYTEYKLIDDRKVKLFYHKVVGKQDDTEKDHIISIVTWIIQSDGKIKK